MAVVASFVVLIVAGLPVAFVLGMSAATGILLSPDGTDYLPALPQALFNMFNSFTFVTIPLFVFAGSIMAEGGVARSLMELASVTVGRGRGGLGSSVEGEIAMFLPRLFNLTN
jgi:C4-dicarboxylate transporter DctM subunit